MTQPSLFTPEPVQFRGTTYVEALDGKRLRSQMQRVAWVMADGKWRTIMEICNATWEWSNKDSGYPDSGPAVSARLRDFNNHDKVRAVFSRSSTEQVRMERRRKAGGLHEYRVLNCVVRV